MWGLSVTGEKCHPHNFRLAVPGTGFEVGVGVIQAQDLLVAGSRVRFDQDTTVSILASTFWREIQQNYTCLSCLPFGVCI